MCTRADISGAGVRSPPPRRRPREYAVGQGALTMFPASALGGIRVPSRGEKAEELHKTRIDLMPSEALTMLCRELSANQISHISTLMSRLWNALTTIRNTGRNHCLFVMVTANLRSATQRVVLRAMGCISERSYVLAAPHGSQETRHSIMIMHSKETLSIRLDSSASRTQIICVQTVGSLLWVTIAELAFAFGCKFAQGGLGDLLVEQ